MSLPKQSYNRDLTRALTLRPREVWLVYGLPESTVCELCKHPDPKKRMPSTKIEGRKGRKGMRLIPHASLRRFLGLPPLEGLRD